MPTLVNRAHGPAHAECASLAPESLYDVLVTSSQGLTEVEAAERLAEYGPNEPVREKKSPLRLFVSKFFNILVVVLLIIGTITLVTAEEAADQLGAGLVFLMAIVSVVLSFVQEYRAGREAEKLREMVRATTSVFRDGQAREINIREVVPGDLVSLSAGDMIPADLRVVSCKDLFVNQASLTGESFPAEKTAEAIQPRGSSLSDLSNMAFMGSSVVSGTAHGLVVRTGLATQFGELSKKLAQARVTTAFEKGISAFTWLMIRFMIALVVIVFLIRAFKGGWTSEGIKEAVMFALAVAVGLTPEMLPMIVAVCLSKGAIAMSRKRAIVKRLNSMQNFGALDVLCTDKTGTLTLDKIVLEQYCDVVGREDESVLRYVYLNSFYQTGLKNLLDKAILDHKALSLPEYRKVDEIPFDFSRRIMSVVVDSGSEHILIVKGAPEEIFKRSTLFEVDNEVEDLGPLMPVLLPDLREECDRLSSEGFRVLAVAYKKFPQPKATYSREDEHGLVLKGYVAFLDPPKETAKDTILALRGLGIETKVLTGDNELVTRKICQEVGLDVHEILIGDDLEKMKDPELQEKVRTTTVLARLSPAQKERVIRLLRGAGHVVGFLGDGINDAPALKEADVGISVNNAVDIAKESADIILLEKSLRVLEDGILEGRATFANIVKYIKMGASSNFGNMFSMTGSSLVLPFTPMWPIQVLFNNFLYDISQVAIPTDHVDEEDIQRPRPWNIANIRRFMVVFGPVSSIFDFVTFGVMFLLYRGIAQFEDAFRTAWFLESLCTQTLVIHIIRTAKIPFIESRPSRVLLLTSILIVLSGFLAALMTPHEVFRFVALPASYFGALALILSSYLVLAQLVKGWFFRRFGGG